MNEYGKPDYTSAVPCTCTIERNKIRRHEHIVEYARMGNLANCTFESLRPEGTSTKASSQEIYKKAFTACKQYAENPSGWLYICGGPSSGKTRLSAAIGNLALKNDVMTVYYTASDLIDQLRPNLSNDTETDREDILTDLEEIPLLIIDDYGLQSNTAWAREKLDQILTYRINNELPTVLASDIHPRYLDDRWQRRLSDSDFCRIVELDAENSNEVYEWPEDLALQKTMTFDNFDQRPANLEKDVQDNLQRAYEVALGFAQEPDGWLVFQGVTGCGKTHLAASIVNYRYDHKQPATFVVVPEILNRLKATFSSNSDETYIRILDQIKRAPLLVLDDFSLSSPSPWENEVLYQMINSRYNSKLPTIVTMSHRYDEIDRRIASRLADTRVSNTYLIKAPDFRFKTEIKPAKPAYTPRKSRYS